MKSRNGFTLIEVMVSIVILAIGLLSVAAFVTSTVAMGTRARYMNQANVLASEKLDDLNKLPSTDPNLSCTGAPASGTVCGSLTGGAACSGSDFCDQVTVNEANGADYEIQTENVNGTLTTTTIVHTDTGCVGTPASCGVAAPANAGSSFTRRWEITYDPSINEVGGGPTTATGTMRVTVLVTLNGGSNGIPVTFQMSMVRP
ncbi:MAG TPA: prepilin-type N-terminal cleavage/methylation domain-containing protein [Candidatus Acidoferrum sp.]|nr:prepilin-type N-terminal cleavage/methylation domain-containing protein [Candidatus Acidoferrum sp.]